MQPRDGWALAAHGRADVTAVVRFLSPRRLAIAVALVFVLEALVGVLRGDWPSVDRASVALLALAVGFSCGKAHGEERLRERLRPPVAEALELARRINAARRP